jgi:ribosomal protein RSM22 (predicted rRNA methylase)
MHPPAWCHFSERLPRSRQHRLVKAAQVNYEDEPFIYLAFTRSAVPIRPQGRIVSRVRVSKAELRFSLCRKDGSLVEEVVPRRDREAFSKLRRASWGEALLSGTQKSKP